MNDLIKKSLFIVGSLVVLIFIFILYNQSKSLAVKDILGEKHFNLDAGIFVEKIIDQKEFTTIEIEISEVNQKEIILLLEDLKLKKSGKSFGPLDAKYIISSKSNFSKDAYLFSEDNVIVFPSKSSEGYFIKDEKFIQKMEELLP